MSISPLPLSYCTNVHPGSTLSEVERGLREYAAPIQLRVGRPIAVGLWLADAVTRQLVDEAGAIERLTEILNGHRLGCYTLNAFPFGDFHGPRVKEQVYTPAWDHPHRLAYTRRCATILSRLLPPAGEGSISTLPLGFEQPPAPPIDLERATQQLIDLAVELQQIEAHTGKVLRLAIEPEPLCVLETTSQTIGFFHRLFAAAAASGHEPEVRRHIGVCFDVCHQAVEFEDVEASIAALDAAGVRINKVHLSCAIRLERPAQNLAGRAALRRYVDPRYLHQTLALHPDGRRFQALDLDDQLITDPPPDFAAAREWRVHYHVPIDLDTLGPLGTTHPDLHRAIRAAGALPYAPHLEVETYTWEILPNRPAPSIADGIAHELIAARTLISASAPAVD